MVLIFKNCFFQLKFVRDVAVSQIAYYNFFLISLVNRTNRVDLYVELILVSLSCSDEIKTTTNSVKDNSFRFKTISYI